MEGNLQKEYIYTCLYTTQKLVHVSVIIKEYMQHFRLGVTQRMARCCKALKLKLCKTLNIK